MRSPGSLHPQNPQRRTVPLQAYLRHLGRNFWKGEFMIFLCVLVGCLFHLSDAPKDFTITPFFLLPDFQIHPEPFTQMGTFRVQVMILLAVIMTLIPKLRTIATVLFFLQVIDLFDYLLRYGQDYLPNVDINTLKVLACLVIGSVSLIKFFRKHEIKG